MEVALIDREERMTVYIVYICGSLLDYVEKQGHLVEGTLRMLCWGWEQIVQITLFLSKVTSF